jgi:TolB-like protein
VRFRILMTEFRHRGVFKVAAAYVALGLAALEGMTHLFHNFEAPHWVLKVLTTLLIAGFPVACLMAWGFQFTSQGVRLAPTPREDKSTAPQTPTSQDDLARPAIAAQASVAVLPFVDMSAAGDQQYFGDGIAEELISALSRIEGLRVAARTSTFALHSAGASMEEFGRVLHVAYVLEGSVRRAGERVRITAQLIDVASGYHLFSQSYDRRIEDVLEIQNEIAHELVTALLPRLGLDPDTPLIARTCCNLEAHELRMRARHTFHRYTLPSLDEAIELLRQAVALDPGYAAAWGDLGYMYNFRANSSESVAWLARAQAAASQALALEPDNAQALQTQAISAALLRYEHVDAERLFRNAFGSGADLSFWTFNFATTCLLPQGRYAEALEQVERARDLDPLGPDLILVEFGALQGIGPRFQARMLSLARTVRAADSPGTWRATAAVFYGLVEAGDWQQAGDLVAYVSTTAGEYSTEAILAKAHVNGVRGDASANHRLLHTLIEQRREGKPVPAYPIGVIHAELAEYDEAMDWFSHAADAHDPLFFSVGTVWYRTHPVIGKHPRFHALLRRMNLPEHVEAPAGLP